MSVGNGVGGVVGATVDIAGSMPATAYQAFVGQPPTDPTTAISTTGATGAWTETTLTGQQSTIDTSVNYLRGSTCHSTRHVAGQATLLPFVMLQGFQNSAADMFSSTFKRRFADYVDAATGVAPFVICSDPRGRINGDADKVDYCRDSYDRLDIVNAAIAAKGATNFVDSGNALVLCGYSTGAIDAALFACRFPDRVAAIVMYWPNFDLWSDAEDSYGALVSSTQRQYMIDGVGDRGTGGVAAVDPWLARNAAIDGLARIMALPNGPHVWIITDTRNPAATPLPDHSRLISALRAYPGSAAKLHVHVSTSGDDHVFLHSESTSGAGNIWAERYFVPTILSTANAWTMPRESPATGLRVFGFMETRTVTGSTDPADDRPGFKLWLGSATSPRTTKASGGKTHYAELTYREAGGQLTIDPRASTNGYAQAIRGYDNRNEQFTAGTPHTINFSVAPTITTLADLGVTWLVGTSDAGTITGAAPVTAWAPQIGSGTLTSTAGKQPATGTDGDGKTYIGFTAASQHRLGVNSALFDATGDWTFGVVVSFPNATLGALFDFAHVVHNTGGYIQLFKTSGPSVEVVVNRDGPTNALAGSVAQTTTTTTKHFIAVKKQSGYIWLSVDGAAWTKSAVSGTLAASDRLTIGAWYANSIDDYFRWADVNFYSAFVANGVAWSRAQLEAARALMQTDYTF